MLNLHVSENQVVLAYLARRGRRESLVSPTNSPLDPYWELGSHPDIVERVWDELGSALSQETRQIVCDTPALVHPITGVVFALTVGTSYVLRFSSGIAKEAKNVGFQTIHTWSDGTITDLESDLGSEWFFGRWSPLEITWLRETYAPLMSSDGCGESTE